MRASTHPTDLPLLVAFAEIATILDRWYLLIIEEMNPRMITSLSKAAWLEAFKRGMPSALLIALLSLGTKAFAGDCVENEMPDVLRDVSSKILGGDYDTFFDLLSKPTIVGGQIDYTDDEISVLKSAFPNGFSDCFTMLSGSRNSNHQQFLISFYGDDFGLFLYLEAFRPKEAWEIWDYRLSTSFSETRALMN
ncbi:hypothetical protein [uncultured Marivita sp.]|uniref:hypothetical protein n=1 Tax=Marivita sp. TaxID=2003365 RepID=UPI0025DBAB1B|nr:hypothetical protein [uncultured Marivita sp.]